MKIAAGVITSLLLIVLAGCGGGSSSVQTPTIKSASIATFQGNSNGATGPFDARGGYAQISVFFSSPSGIASNSVVIDVKDASGKSIISGGPKNMSAEPYPNSINVQSYVVNYSLIVPANTTSQTEVYTVTVTASDNAGHKITPPATVGTITVPGCRFNFAPIRCKTLQFCYTENEGFPYTPPAARNPP